MRESQERAAAPGSAPRTAARVRAVAWREFTHTALTKAFVIGAVVVPVLMFGVIAAIPILTSGAKKPIDGTIAIVDPDGLVAAQASAIFDEIRRDPASADAGDPDAEEALRSMPSGMTGDPRAMQSAMEAARAMAMQPADISVRLVRPGEDLAPLRSELARGSLLALVELPQGVLDPDADAAVRIVVPSTSSPLASRLIRRQLQRAVVRARAERAGEDWARLEGLVREPPVDLSRMTESGAEARESIEARMIIPGAFMLLLWVTVFSSANQLLTTTIEEKSSKVMEVLLSAVSPGELLSGKILGQALVSAVMMLMYGGVAIVGLAAMTMLDLLPVSLALLFVACFVMAYFTIAAMMAAAGSAVNDLREVQTLAGPIMTVMVVPLMLWVPIVEHPNGMLATVSTFVPTLTPFILVLRCAAATEPVPGWQVAAAIAWGALVTVAAFWLAARIFRVGVLMQGKPPTPRELLRWAWAR